MPRAIIAVGDAWTSLALRALASLDVDGASVRTIGADGAAAAPGEASAYAAAVAAAEPAVSGGWLPAGASVAVGSLASGDKVLALNVAAHAPAAVAELLAGLVAHLQAEAYESITVIAAAHVDGLKDAQVCSRAEMQKRRVGNDVLGALLLALTVVDGGAAAACFVTRAFKAAPVSDDVPRAAALLARALPDGGDHAAVVRAAAASIVSTPSRPTVSPSTKGVGLAAQTLYL